MIGAGNVAAHHGDAITDAGLFESGAGKTRLYWLRCMG
jgi:hypothetical protein